MKEFKRNCPVCQKDQTYVRKSGLTRAIKENRLCLSCSMTGRFFSDKTRQIISENMTGNKNHRFGKISWNKGKSSWSKGKTFSPGHKSKISISLNGKPLSENHKYKLRLATIKDLERKGIVGKIKNHNPVACKFIDTFNSSYGLNLQHALNGGEVELYGYFVDGYDKDKNIIFEYDEPRHQTPYKNKRDLLRQENLLREIRPILFIRYDEKGKRLYDVITRKNFPLVIV